MAHAAATTYVSLTFDNSVANQFTVARPVLVAHGTPATFFVSSGKVGTGTKYLTWDQTRQLSADGNEVGSKSRDNVDLTTTSNSLIDEICGDKTAIEAQGLPIVRSFAYPQAAYNATVETMVKTGCGAGAFTSARRVGGLYHPTLCPSCPPAETIPPADWGATRTANSVRNDTTLAALQAFVTNAQPSGGWVQFVFTNVCLDADTTCRADTYSITTSLLSAFLDWLVSQASNDTSVRTVEDVMAGGHAAGPLTATADEYWTTGTLAVPAAGGVLANDSQFDGDPLTAVLVNQSAAHGVVTLSPDGAFSYAPDNGYSGAATFEYRAQDVVGGISQGPVVVTVHVGDTGPARARTTVSLTFDDGTLDHATLAAPLLDARGLHGTFFVNTATVGTDSSRYLSWDQLRGLAARGHEAGSHAVTHVDLTSLDPAAATSQICGSVTTLQSQGIGSVRSFAYPMAATNPTVEQLVLDCGMTTGRVVGRLYDPAFCTDTADCPYAESLPPLDMLATRTANSVFTTTTVAALERYVDDAGRHGGGWIQYVFHHVCAAGDGTCLAEQQYAITTTALATFLDWLTFRAALGDVVVSTVAAANTGATVPPTATDDEYTVAWPTTVVPTSLGVLANDVSGSGSQLSARLVDVSNAHGSVTLAADGSFTFVPDTTLTDRGTFTYAAHDAASGLDSSPATVTLLAAAAPAASPDTYTTHHTALAVDVVHGVLANDGQADGHALEAALADSSAAHGTVTLARDGSFSYVPTVGYLGTAQFAYRALDPITGRTSAATTVQIEVVDSPPRFTAGIDVPFQVQYGDPLAYSVAAIDDDDPVTALRFSASGLPSGLTMSQPAVGTGTATVATTTGVGSAAGTFTPQYTVSDGLTTVTTVGAAVTVVPEQAAVTLTGAPYVATASNGRLKSVTLRATVTQAADGSLGDLTKARVRFDVFAGSASLAGTPTARLFASVTSAGAASVSWTGPTGSGLGPDVYTVVPYVVGVASGATYFAGSGAPAPFTVYTASASRTASGGGTVTDTGSGSTIGSLGFLAAASTASGAVAYVYDAGSGSSVVVRSVPGTWPLPATFPSSKSTAFAAPAARYSVDRATGAITVLDTTSALRYDATDGGSTPAADRVAITVTSAGSVSHSVGSSTSPVPLLTGGVVVRSR